MNLYLKNYVRGLTLGAVVCVVLVVYGLLSLPFLTLWVALPLVILPYILLFSGRVYEWLIAVPIRHLSGQAFPGPRRQWLMGAFVLGYFSALCVLLFFTILGKTIYSDG
jgi:asparagine N-glycosylation enzyme membrane subunit Stt3